MIDLLTRLCSAWGPAGAEHVVRDVVMACARPYADNTTVDNLGNLIVRKGTPGGRRIMLSAHMDEIGLIITHIDEKGFLRCSNIGGISPSTLMGQAVRFGNGIVGVIGCEKIDDPKDLKLEKLFIDIGAADAATAGSLVKVGDVCCYHRQIEQTGNRVIGKALDDRSGCAVLLAVMQQLSHTPHDIYFVFSTQEEVGSRGAQAAAYAIAPEIGIAVDVTSCGDTPNARILPVSLGRGAAIKVMDHSVICHPKVRRLLTDTAQTAGIRHQAEVLPTGGTDAGPIHLSRAGVPSGAISIPTRYIHTPVEMADLGDIAACVQLLTTLLSSDFAW